MTLAIFACLGKLHGGAAALAIEKACMYYLNANEQISALEVIYLAPAKVFCFFFITHKVDYFQYSYVHKGKVQIALSIEAIKNESMVTSSKRKINGKVVSAMGGQVYSEFTATITANMQ